MQTGCLEETQMVEPANSYAVAKDSLRRFLTELAKQHSFSLKWLRLFYMYGKDQAPNSLIPQLHLAVSQGQKSFNMSPGDQVRDFLPVEKVAEYICTAALQNKVSGIINVCSGNPVQVKDFVKEYMLQHDINIELNTGYYPYNPLEPFAFWGNRDKLNKVLDATSV
jgi:dTDP-6-deoxy-L-talose 4-dehydrogenase (NAD+)